MSKPFALGASMLLVALASLAAAGCKKGDGEKADDGGCSYKGIGYCFSPPKDLRVEPNGTDTVNFHRAKNYISVNTFPPQAKTESDSTHDFIKKHEKVLADAVIDGGKGWYIETDKTTYIRVQAQTTGKKFSVGCVLSVPPAEKASAKDMIEACKTLRAVD
jgi:hypothetical protein